MRICLHNSQMFNDFPLLLTKHASIGFFVYKNFIIIYYVIHVMYHIIDNIEEIKYLQFSILTSRQNFANLSIGQQLFFGDWNLSRNEEFLKILEQKSCLAGN
jgi:hypothetical protein